MELIKIRSPDEIATSPILETGDVIPSIVIPSTSLVQRGSYWFLVWASQITIGNPSSSAQIKDAKLQSLYEKLWLQNAYTLTPSRGTISSSDWSAGKILTLPSLQGRSISVFNSESSLLNGASTATLSIANLPSHDHGGGSHSHGGTVYTYACTPIQWNWGYYNSYSYIGWGAAAVSAWQAGNLGLSINASGNVIATEGSSTPINIVPPRAAIARCLLVYLGQF